MLIPGTLLRRAMKGEIPLQDEVMKAVGRLSAPAGEAPSGPFGAEKALLRNLKDAFLVLAGAAVQRFGAKVKDEQETLIALADVAIGVFAIESAVLRAEKIAASGNASRAELSAREAFPEAAIFSARSTALSIAKTPIATSASAISVSCSSFTFAPNRCTALSLIHISEP